MQVENVSSYQSNIDSLEKKDIFVKLRNLSKIVERTKI